MALKKQSMQDIILEGNVLLQFEEYITFFLIKFYTLLLTDKIIADSNSTYLIGYNNFKGLNSKDMAIICFRDMYISIVFNKNELLAYTDEQIVNKKEKKKNPELKNIYLIDSLCDTINGLYYTFKKDILSKSSINYFIKYKKINNKLMTKILDFINEILVSLKK